MMVHHQRRSAARVLHGDELGDEGVVQEEGAHGVDVDGDKQLYVACLIREVWAFARRDLGEEGHGADLRGVP